MRGSVWPGSYPNWIRFGLPGDADLLECERIEIHGQPKIRPCLGQHFLADELLVLAELLPERRKRLAPALDLEVVEQLLQALDQDRAVGQVALHLRPGRREEVRYRPPSAGQPHGLHRDGFVAAHEASVLA